ncbi:ABC transporter ATP-binding protein [Terrabacter sp. NPDC080008]|uniref:ABC transporter ATP-binding protein n=1 Tax=Terrabacter sp. NPDC080008 TaxID=3155176 RepID=UPI00344D9D08
MASATLHDTHRSGPTPAAHALEVHDVHIRFSSKRGEVTALEGIDLTVERGEFVSIAGPSGCGKSTLLKAVAGLTRPSRGEVVLNGSTVTGPRPDIGYVFQRAALLEWRTVEGNILLQGEMRGMPKDRARARARDLIAMTGLEGFEGALPHELSGGMQQRVSLCRALLHEPEVLLMDEPFGALDALTRERMNVELHRIWEETGTTVLLVTHSVPEAVYLANRVVVMSPRPGRVLRELDVALPRHRVYAETMADPVFQDLTTTVRDLLGTSGEVD